MVSGQDVTAPDSQPDRDAVTVGKLLAGDDDGLQRLLQDHGGLIRTRLRKDFGNTLDDSEIDEVMNTMVVKVWQAARRFSQAHGTLRAWAHVIAHNTALRHMENRRRSSMRPQADLDRFAVAIHAPASPTSERRRLLADLHRCIEQLPPLQRAVLKADLQAGDTLPAGPLATRLGTTASSIYVSRLKGRASLREALTALGHTLGVRRPTAARPEILQPPFEPRAEQG